MFTSSSSLILSSQRHLFDVPEEVTFLNCSGLSPQLRTSTEAGLTAVRQKASPWQVTAADWFAGPEQLRKLVGQLLSTDAGNIALIPSASYGIAIAAANVPVQAGQSIVLLDQEFPSNVYAWRELARRKSATVHTVRRKTGISWTQAILKAITNQTAVVSVPNCHWTDGSLVDLIQIGEKVRSAGASLVVDASQSLGAYPLNIADIQPDFLVSVGYKWLLSPYGLGYLYAAPKWHQGQPIEYSWMARHGSEEFSRLTDYQDAYRSGAKRFDVGEFTNFIHAPMAIAAFTQILEWSVPAIQQSIAQLTGHLAQLVTEAGCTVPAERVGHMIGVRLPNGISEPLKDALIEEKIYVSFRGDSIRVAPHVYNSLSDIDRFFSVLQRFV